MGPRSASGMRSKGRMKYATALPRSILSLPATRRSVVRRHKRMKTSGTSRRNSADLPITACCLSMKSWIDDRTRSEKRFARSSVTGPRPASSATLRSRSSGVRVSSIFFLRGCRQVCAAFAKNHVQAAVDDPDSVNFGVNKIWQETIQREHQRGRLLVAYQFGGKAVAHQPEEKFRNRDHAECRNRAQRDAHLPAAGGNFADLNFKGNADEFLHRPAHADQPVFKPDFELLDRFDTEGLDEGVQLLAVDAKLDLVPFDESFQVLSPES